MTSPQRRAPKAGDVITDPVHGETVRWLKIGSDTSVTSCELTAQPQASGPPVHSHPRSYERFEVRAGAIRLRSGRQERVVRAGETVTVAPRTAHTWYNHTDEPAVVLVEWNPGYSAAEFLDEWYEMAREGRLDSKGDLGLLEGAALFYPHLDAVAMPRIPLGIQRVLMRSLSWLGQRRGSGA
jgi:quercetin dioxygenase-like cupin family protein